MRQLIFGKFNIISYKKYSSFGDPTNATGGTSRPNQWTSLTYLCDYDACRCGPAAGQHVAYHCRRSTKWSASVFERGRCSMCTECPKVYETVSLQVRTTLMSPYGSNVNKDLRLKAKSEDLDFGLKDQGLTSLPYGHFSGIFDFRKCQFRK